MKRGIGMAWQYDSTGQLFLRITKKRGKLTLEEITDLLRYEDSQKYCGRYAIMLNCIEDTIGGNGMFLEEDEKGDAVDLYLIEGGETCPVCVGSTPPFEYCPSCGAAWKDADLNAETLIAGMRAETERAIGNDKAGPAPYWSYIGALDMARRLGMITDKRRQELCREAEELKEQTEEGGLPS